MRRATQGFALVVAMLVGLVVLLVIVTTASISTLGTRRSVSDERQTYRTLLVAESGINTFQARMRQSQYRGAIDADTLNAWVTCSNGTGPFCLDGFPTDASVTLRVAVVDPTRVTVTSTGALGAEATKVVVSDFSVSFRPGFNLPLGAALTSLPTVKVGGNASINGALGSDPSAGLIAALTTVAADFSSDPFQPLAAGDTFTLTVGDATYLPVGGYVQIQDSNGAVATYKVVAKSGNDLQLEVLQAPAGDVTITATTAVDFVPFAAVSAADPNVEAVSTIEVSDVSGFTEGMTVFIDGWKGTVQPGGVDPDTSQVTVAWDGSVTGTSTIQEGDAFARNVDDVASGSTIDVGGNAVACGHLSGGTGTYDPNLCSDQYDPSNPLVGMTGDELFEATFGMTVDEFNAAYPPVSTFDGQAPAGVVINVNASLNLGGGDQICGGPAILVVQGDLTLNGSCDPSADNPDGGFHGLIYVTGQFRQQGNSDIFGAVVVDGTYSTVGPDTTTVTGTNNPQADGSKIQYDMAALLQAGSALSPRLFQPVAGTWRQRAGDGSQP